MHTKFLGEVLISEKSASHSGSICVLFFLDDVPALRPSSKSNQAWLNLCVNCICVLCALLTGSMKSVQFSPDRAALQSILQNEGVKGGGFVGTPLRVSVCQSGRGTSIYTVCKHYICFHYGSFLKILLQTQFHLLWCFLSQAQRVPVRKNRAEPTGGGKKQNHCYLMKPNASLSLCPFPWRDAAVLSSAPALKETPLKKWTPQRVPVTRHQPMSAMVSKHVLYVHVLSLFGMWCLSQSLPYLTTLLFSEMASVVTTVPVCRHSRAAELQNRPSATPRGESRKSCLFYNAGFVKRKCLILTVMFSRWGIYLNWNIPF